jgi:hypothetical protein
MEVSTAQGILFILVIVALLGAAYCTGWVSGFKHSARLVLPYLRFYRVYTEALEKPLSDDQLKLILKEVNNNAEIKEHGITRLRDHG